MNMLVMEEKHGMTAVMTWAGDAIDDLSSLAASYRRCDSGLKLYIFHAKELELALPASGKETSQCLPLPKR